MFFTRLYDDDLAQASYLIGCQASGEAVVIDPRRDVAVYLREAARRSLKIVGVSETHIHADYLSGTLELAHATGALLYLSDEGGEAWRYGFPHQPLSHSSILEVGKITLEARHTPGHTPEHLAFLVTDGAAADAPSLYLTGDFVFAGDLGRPDLLDETGNGEDTRRPAARRLFRSLQEEFLTRPDFVQVWPGHGAGSACGKTLGAVPCTTVGYERRFAWWSGLLEDEAGFVEALLAGQPDAPSYFGRMKRLNRAGPPLLGARPALRELTADALRNSDLLLLDTRPREAFHRGAAPGSLHLPAGGSFASYAAWMIDPDHDPRGLVLLATNEGEAQGLRNKLARVGIDNVVGYLTSLAGLERRPIPTVAPDKLDGLHDPFLLDVRTKGEFEAGHLPGATRLHAGRLLEHLSELPRDRPIVIYCQSGARSATAASAVRGAGFEVLELEGSYRGWRNAQKAGS